MSIIFVRRTGVACLIALAALLLLVPIALRAANTSSVLEACINPGNGGMRLVDAGEACHKNETRVQWNVEGPAGPPGPTGATGATGATGPAGPPGPSSGGAPYVWICTPGHFPNSGSNSRADVYIYNASATTANVTVIILDKDGNNLAGHTVPGSPASTYPGDAAPVPLAVANTRDFEWLMPTVTPPAFTDVAFTVRVTSDQSVVVGSNFQFDGRMPNQCSLVPK